jgi:hypothetical protein
MNVALNPCPWAMPAHNNKNKITLLFKRIYY